MSLSDHVDERLPALLPLLRSTSDKERALGLSCLDAALATGGHGYRIVGPEFQGLKPRAKLWIPTTYGDWWDAQHLYLKTLINETVNWPDCSRARVCSALLSAVKQQIKIKPCTQLAFDVLSELVNDPQMDPSELNKFFADWSEDSQPPQVKDITTRIVAMGRAYARQSLITRFQRYVVDIDWLTWNEDIRERRGKRNNRTKPLVNALAKRLVTRIELFDSILPVLSPARETPALWHFGEQLARRDVNRKLQEKLVSQTLVSKDLRCLGGYLSFVQKSDALAFQTTVHTLLSSDETAWLGTALTMRSEYDHSLFVECIAAFDKGWIEPVQFSALRYGQMWQKVPVPTLKRLIQLLSAAQDSVSRGILLGLFHDIPFDDAAPFTSADVYATVCFAMPSESGWDSSLGHDWQNVCQKLIKWDATVVQSLLTELLSKMAHDYRWSYDHNIAFVSMELVMADPVGAWNVISHQFESKLPKWRSDLTNWLKGGIAGFDEKAVNAPINWLPIVAILEWIDVAPETRAGLIAHCVPGTLCSHEGGQLVSSLITKYHRIDGVKSGISAAFHSGGWTGPTSLHFKTKRSTLRDWLSGGFDFEVNQWIESELEHIDKRIEWEEISEERTRFD